MLLNGGRRDSFENIYDAMFNSEHRLNYLENPWNMGINSRHHKQEYQKFMAVNGCKADTLGRSEVIQSPCSHPQDSELPSAEPCHGRQTHIRLLASSQQYATTLTVYFTFV